MPDKPDETKWKFATLDGVEWTFRITYGSVKSVLDQTGFKLTDLFFDQKASEEVTGDGFRMLEIIYAALKPQADEKGISIDRFLAAVDGDVLERASLALLEALTDFFPHPRRTIVRRALDRYHREKERLTSGVIHAIEKEIDAMSLEQPPPLTHTSSATSSPASAA
jgi:hypothetical protein